MKKDSVMERQFVVSISPYIRDDTTISRIMYSVVLALLPALVGAVYFFGFRVLELVLISIGTAVLVEAGMQKLFGKPVTVSDGSAIVTGMLLAFVIPPGVPFWLPIVGSAFAITIGKQVFGGLGYNPLNPALLGRAFLLASWPVYMTTAWKVPRLGTLSGIDLVTTATPLRTLKEAHQALTDVTATPEQIAQAKHLIAQLPTSYLDLSLGNVGGSIGETSVILLLIGAAYLFAKGIIGWRTPATFIATVAFFTWIFGGVHGPFTGDPLFHVLAGGLILGAFFMATDMVTSPVTPRGKLIFGAGCGVITVMIRLVGGYPEGVCYSILLMNAFTPLIDRWTKPKPFGQRK